MSPISPQRGEAKSPDPQTGASSATPPLLSSTPWAPLPSGGVSIEGVRQRLWNQAHDRLKSSEAKVVESYENFLLAELQIAVPQSQDSDPIRAIDAHIRPGSEERWRQMERLVRIRLSKTEKSTRLKARISDALDTTSPGKALIGEVIQAYPQAAVT